LYNIIFQGNFGISYQTQISVSQEIKSRLPWSLTLSLLSVFFAFGISIPIGMYAAKYRGRFFDKTSAVGLFMMYSLPNFFVATMLLVFFANPQFLNWFPESGVQDAINFDNNWPFWIKVQHWAPYLVLPLITYTYSSIAFLSRQMRAGAVEIFDQEFIKTARAKGLSESKILWKHVFRNALMPIITIFANVFPAAIVGSIIVETIFALPGMGHEIYDAVLNYDYPVIVAVFTIFGFLTLVGYLVSDILYAIADPRISYSKK
jgi:peptide/nickel transport system permease protein